MDFALHYGGKIRTRIVSRELPDIESLLYEALKLGDPQERQAYLEAACGVGTTLRAEIDSLLRAYESGADVLKAPTDLLNEPADTLHEDAGDAIGRYRLLEKIGEGGMAVVYMAEQERPIRRKVALKIIKVGMDTRQVIARFEAERQALAMMDHPNIAKVFDAGATETGRPYFVMELVTGVSITEYCDKNELSTKDRLALFSQVCSAVQHAHQRGIIHRDLKPSNIMVTMHDDGAVPKIIDFGIAKATKQRLTEKTLFTRYAQVIGTPAYMSPEQAQMSDLDIDTRSDIYSLGVLLYELLTGTAPFAEEQLRRAGYAEMQRIICEEEPVKPSTKLSTLGETLTEIAKQRCSTPESLHKTMRGDLDWIVMKSLEKNRVRRYETASAFKRDIQRYLQHEPVHARRPGTVYRLKKYLYRHRVQAIVALAAVVLVGAIITVITVTKADREQRSVNAERAAHGNKLLQVREFLANGDRQLALNLVEPLRQSPHVGPKARLLYAGILVDDARIEPAKKTLEELFKENPQIAGAAHALMARLLWENLSANDPEGLKAIEEHKQQAEALLPQNADACFVRALTSLTIKEKLGWLDQALALDRKHYESRKLRALIYQASRKYQELKDDAELLTFQKEKEPLGYVLLATALENLDDDSGALAQYDCAIELTPADDPRHVNWTIQRCDLLLRMGEYERVIADVETYRDQIRDRISQTGYEPTRDRVNLDYCVFYALTALGQYERAEALYQRIACPAVRSSPKLRVNRGFRNWSTEHIFDDLEAGRSWHAPGRIPQGAAFDAMREAEDAYHHLRPRAAPLFRGFSPAWSPDGTKLAFSLGTYGISGVAVHDFTSQETELLITPGRSPSWSPDGKYIAFVRDRQSLRFSTLVTAERHHKFAYRRFEEIWIMEADGSQPRRICTGTFPSWSQEYPNVIYYYSNADLMLYALAVDDQNAEPRPIHACTNWYSQQSYNMNLPLNVSPDGRYMAKVGINALEIVERGDGHHALSMDRPRRNLARQLGPLRPTVQPGRGSFWSLDLRSGYEASRSGAKKQSCLRCRLVSRREGPGNCV